MATEMAPENADVAGWHYGYAEINSEKNRVIRFERFPTFHEERWAGGTKLPDPNLGWCSLTRNGGHAGGDLGRCPVRRWVADRDCVVQIESRLKHSSDKGDGVHGHVITNSQNVAAAHAHNNSAVVNTSDLSVKAGDAIDFVVDCGENESFDSFEWKVVIDQSVDGARVRRWDSEKEFSGARPTGRLTPAAQLAQTLLLTNEFLFVD